MTRILTSLDLANVSIGTRIRRSRYISYLANKEFNNVLECGCGIGTYTMFLKTISTHLVSYDISGSLIKSAKKSISNAKFLVAVNTTMPFKDKSFDLVIAADVIEHTNNATKALNELARVTKKSGLLALSVPCQNWNVACALLGLSMHSFGHNYLFKKEEILYYLENTNYEIILYEKVQGFFSALLEGLIVKFSSRLYGADIVKESKMALVTSQNRINSFIYFWGSIIFYPAFLFSEALLPDVLNFEHFVVAKKK